MQDTASSRKAVTSVNVRQSITVEIAKVRRDRCWRVSWKLLELFAINATLRCFVFIYVIRYSLTSELPWYTLALVSNPCARKPCKNGGKCTSDFDGQQYQCQCPEGFRGTNCEGKRQLKSSHDSMVWSHLWAREYPLIMHQIMLNSLNFNCGN